MTDLTKMTTPQLRTLRAQINEELTAREASGSSTPETPETDVHTVFNKVSGDTFQLPPLPILKKQSKGYTGFVKECVALCSYVDEHFRTPSRVQRMRGIQLCLEVFLAWMDKRDIPLSTKTVMEQLPKARSLVERVFPGYRQSGLLHITLDSYVPGEYLNHVRADR